MTTSSVSYEYGKLSFTPEIEASANKMYVIDDLASLSERGIVEFSEISDFPPFILLGDNDISTVALLYAAGHYNCTVVILAKVKRYILDHIMTQTGINMVVSADENFKLNVEKFDKLGCSEWLEDGKYSKGALGILTSGTTSLPKVCIRTWDAITTDKEALTLPVGPKYRFVIMTSITHIYAMKNVFIAIIAASQFKHDIQYCMCSSASQAIELLKEPCDRFTTVFGTPSFFDYLCQLELPKLYMQIPICGGSLLSRDILEKINEKFGVTINQAYASTELGIISMQNMENIDSDLSVTKLMPGTEIELRSPHNGAVLRDGEEGAIHGHTSSQSIGYIQNGKLKHHPYFFYTGDSGRLDRNKYSKTGELGIKLGQRLRNPIPRMIESFDVHVQGFQIEFKLLEHPSIVNALVIVGGKDKNLMVASIVIKNGDNVTEEVIWEWCRQNLPEFAMPDEIKFVDYLKCDGVGKLTLH